MANVVLRSHVHAADVGGDLVLLDVIADSYQCLPGAGPAWQALCDGREAPTLAAVLVHAALAIPADAASPPRPVDPALPACRIRAVAASVAGGDRVRLLLAFHDLLRRYRRRPFAEILAHVRTADVPDPPASDPDALARLCAVFERLVVWLPVSSACLERSYLLLRFLQRSGHDARWRFGVRLWPFAAHCWLQVGDTALDDWPERLAGYTPIHDA